MEKSCWLARHTFALWIDRITLVLLHCYPTSRVPFDLPRKIGKKEGSLSLPNFPRKIEGGNSN